MNTERGEDKLKYEHRTGETDSSMNTATDRELYQRQIETTSRVEE